LVREGELAEFSRSGWFVRVLLSRQGLGAAASSIVVFVSMSAFDSWYFHFDRTRIEKLASGSFVYSSSGEGSGTWVFVYIYMRSLRFRSSITKSFSKHNTIVTIEYNLKEFSLTPRPTELACHFNRDPIQNKGIYQIYINMIACVRKQPVGQVIWH
jgi:hypothetical protein